MVVLPSDVLPYSLLSAEVFGFSDATIDAGPNIVTISIADAKRTLARAGIPDPALPDETYLAAVAKLATSYLMRHFGADKALHVGMTSGHSGQVSTPLGSHAEAMRAADEYARQARDMYPDADWPDLGSTRTAGSHRVRRAY